MATRASTLAQSGSGLALGAAVLGVGLSLGGCGYSWNTGFRGWDDPSVAKRGEVHRLDAGSAPDLSVRTYGGNIDIAPHGEAWPAWAVAAAGGEPGGSAGEMVVIAELGTHDQAMLDGAVFVPQTQNGTWRLATDWGPEGSRKGQNRTRIAVRGDGFGDVAARSGSGEVRIMGSEGDAEITTGSGDVRILDHHGVATVDAGSGDVSVRSTGGPMNLDTGSGDISAHFEGDGYSGAERSVFRAGSGDIGVRGLRGEAVVRTGSGEVAVRMRPDASGDLSIVTGSGDASVHAWYMLDPTWDLGVGSGSITIWYDDSGRADYYDDEVILNGAGPRVDVRTGSGDIDIRIESE